MARLPDNLARWRDAGLISDEQAERILAFEQEAQPARRPAVSRGDVPTVTEAVLYLGIAVAVVGVIVLTAQQWGDLQSWARIASAGVPMVLAFFAGIGLRSQDSPPFKRAADLAWLATSGLAAATTAITASEADLDEYLMLLVVGTVVTVVSAGLWAANPGILQMLGLGASLFMLSTGVGNAVDNNQPVYIGMTLFGLGVVGVGLAEGGLLPPKWMSQVIFAVFAIFGMFMSGQDDNGRMWAELLVFVVGGALIVLSVRRNVFMYMVVAVAGMFVGLITFVFRHLSDTIGVPASLLLCGSAIVGGVLLLRVLRSATRERAA